MMGSIYLIGGGEIRNGETQLIDQHLKSQANDDAVFVFINFAAQDSAHYARTIRSVFGDTFTVLTPTKSKGREYAVEAIRSATVLYLGGGDTDRLIELFDEWNLVDELKAAYERGAHIAGMSAGALAMCSWYIDTDHDEPRIMKGWGLVSLCALVHADGQLFKTATVMAQTVLGGSGNQPFMGIGEGAAWCIRESGEQKIGSGIVWKTEGTQYTIY